MRGCSMLRCSGSYGMVSRSCPKIDTTLVAVYRYIDLAYWQMGCYYWHQCSIGVSSPRWAPHPGRLRVLVTAALLRCLISDVDLVDPLVDVLDPPVLGAAVALLQDRFCVLHRECRKQRLELGNLR